MSESVGSKSADRGKKLSPSQKNNPTKNASSLKVRTKTETSKRGSNSGTIDKYFIKKPETGGLKRSDNNNLCESKSKSTSDSKLEDKQSESETRNAGNSAGAVNLNVPPKNIGTDLKEPSPEPEVIVVDDSFPDSDNAVATKENNSKQGPGVSVSDPEHSTNINGEKELSKTRNGEKKKQIQQTRNQHSKPESQADDEDSTDNVQIESEAETQDTQEYNIDSVGDARTYVDYKEEDFNTDSFFEKSDSESESKEAEDLEQQKEGKSVRASGSNGKKTEMGSFFSRKRRRQEKCQGSSSEEETERPWLQRGSSSREQRARRPYPSRSQLKRRWSDWDTEQYRAGYPDKPDNPLLNKNAEFYQGKIPSRPDGSFIDDFHKQWWHDHDRLEIRHGYIQWLFPIRESGMNLQAQELQRHEAETIRNDPQAMRRFKKSYEMMLYFYGIQLLDKETGEVDRADNWQPRFKHLNHSTHNYLRITRILKCLGEMGLEHFKLPFLQFMLKEAATTRRLDRTLESCTNFWIGTVKDNHDREALDKMAKKLCRGMTAR